jgi:hypothetical protein
MNLKFTQDEKEFLGRMAIGTGIAWPVGFIAAIILSCGVVNLFYPKDTNLIVGFCLGPFVAFSKRFILNKYFKVGTRRVFAAVIGIGVPLCGQAYFDIVNSIG